MSFDLDQLVERVEHLEDELEEERQQRQRLEQELEEERQERQRLEERLESVEPLTVDADDPDDPDLEDVFLGDVPLGRKVRGYEYRLDDLEDDLEAGEQGRPDAADDLEADAPPIYDVLRCPETNLGPTERRTRFLWSDLADYASRTPKGYVLPASDARRVLEAAEPEESDAHRITSKHVGRVFELSADLTRGAVFVRKEGRERQLVVPAGWQEEARDAAPDSVVS